MEGIATLIKTLLRQTPTGRQGWREKAVSEPDITLTLPLSLKGLSLPISFSAWWHSLSRLCQNPSHRLKTCATRNLLNQPLPHLGVMLSPQGKGKYGILCGDYPLLGLLLVLLGCRRRLLLAHAAGFTAGRAFFGFAARVHLIAAFFARKDSHGVPPDQFDPPYIAAPRPERLGALPANASLVAIY
jgi:hypothetical protein